MLCGEGGWLLVSWVARLGGWGFWFYQGVTENTEASVLAQVWCCE